MRKILASFSLYTLLIFGALQLSGCTVIFQKGRRQDIEKISKLQTEYVKLQDELSELERAKMQLEDRLRREIRDAEATVTMTDRGLVITFVAEVLFDSGKAVLRSQALQTLDKISGVLTTTVSQHDVGIEGHTDNVPIRHSGWKSNWELSTARALSVLHYLIEEHGIDPNRLAATGYGEYRPVASNDAAEGRAKNRRVEIVILPNTVKKESAPSAGQNLK